MKKLLLLLLMTGQLQAGVCNGKFLNPITDVCWKCIFPLTIMGVKINSGGGPDVKTSRSPICFCPGKKTKIPTPGIPISFWEPVRLVDVTRIPLCLISMGGVKLGSNIRRCCK